jgi:hypothetical protein
MATYNIIFVSEERLKTFTSINFNLDPSDLIPFVLQGQDIYLQNYLGSTYYIELKNQVEAGTVSTENAYLLDNFIGAALCNYALYMALPFLKYKIFNKGILSPEGENSPGIDLTELKYLRSEVLNTAESYCRKMIDYINDNSADFPTYFSSNSLDGNLPSKQAYTSNLVIPTKRYCNLNAPSSKK